MKPICWRHRQFGVGAAVALVFCSSLGAQEGDTETAYRSADLPPALRFLDGKAVATKADWALRREEIAKLWCDTYIGHFPKDPPKLVGSELVSERRADEGWLVRDLKLTFATPNRASFQIQLWLPENKAAKRPLLLTQPRHYQFDWAKEAARRGYVVCLYPGLDYNHHEKGFPGYQNVWRTFKKEYPKASWSSSLGIQAWLAGRALDYLLAPASGFDIANGQVGIIGHSRYGKQSLYAAAFDLRITAVVSRSAGSPAAAGYRFTGRDTYMETTLDAPGEWMLPSVREYFGREDRLPVESNGLLAMIAPRACMIHTAHNDGSDPTFAVERTYRDAKTAYDLLGKPENLCLLYRKGNHNPITPQHVNANLDWFDLAFGRGEIEHSDYPESLLHAFDWQDWKSEQRKGSLVPPPKNEALRARIEWSLGDEPDWKLPHPKNGKPRLELLSDENYGVAKWSRDRWKPKGVKRVPVSFGENIHGNMVIPVSHKGPLPVVIWLHPFNYSHGYNEGYGVEGTTVYYRLAQAGYAVLCYDQLGFGDRVVEGAHFYEAHKRWSKLGRMLHDVRRAVDFVGKGDGISAEKLPEFDPEKMFLLGYSLGGMVALHAAALDERVAGVASFCGFTPMRNDGDDCPTGGIRRWWQWHALQPKLGLFHSRESEIPYDYDDLIRAVAPRPCLVYSAKKDRHVNADDVAACAARCASPTLQFVHADDVNRFQSAQQKVFLDWLSEIRAGE